MIKNYKQFESLLDKMTGPSKEDISNEIKQKYLDGNLSLYDYYKKTKDLDVPGPDEDELKKEFVNMGQDEFMYSLISLIYKYLDEHQTTTFERIKFNAEFGYELLTVEKTNRYSLLDTLMYSSEGNLINIDTLNIFINLNKRRDFGLLNKIKNSGYVNTIFKSYDFYDDVDAIIHLLKNDIKPSVDIMDDIINNSFHSISNRFSSNYNKLENNIFLKKYKEENYD